MLIHASQRAPAINREQSCLLKSLETFYQHELLIIYQYIFIQTKIPYLTRLQYGRHNVSILNVHSSSSPANILIVYHRSEPAFLTWMACSVSDFSVVDWH